MDAAFYETRVAEKYPTSDNPEMSSLVSRIGQWCNVQDGDRVLDFGCYDGYVLRKLLTHKKVLGSGVDIAPAAIALAQDTSHKDLQFMVSDGNPLPFPAESFEVAICSEILEHVPDMDTVLTEIARVLVPGGRLYATMPNSLNDVWKPFHPLCRHIDRVEGHLRRMSRPEFFAALARHGFRPMRSHYRGFFLSAFWYRTFIYSPRVKAAGIALIGAQTSLRERAARLAAYTAMRGYIGLDAVLSGMRGGMGIDAAFQKTAIQIDNGK